MISKRNLMRRNGRDSDQVRALLKEAQELVAIGFPDVIVERISCALDLSILSVFLFEFAQTGNGNHEVWAICGDVPPAIVTTNARTCEAALKAYARSMLKWVHAVKSGQDVCDLIPVLKRESLQPIPPTMEIAEMLESRMKFILNRVIPEVQKSRIAPGK